MKLTIKLDEINYGDVAVRAMPLLAQSVGAFHGAVGMLVAAISTYLPEELIHNVFDAIPEERKNEFIAEFTAEYKPKILQAVNMLSEKHKIGVNLNDLTIAPNLTVVAQIGKIDYICIADRFLPIIKEKLLNMGGLVVMFRGMIHNASAEQIVGLLDRFVGDNKDAFLASLLNHNQNTLISAIEDIAHKQDIHLKIGTIVMEA